jgi:hypothetical protein
VLQVGGHQLGHGKVARDLGLAGELGALAIGEEPPHGLFVPLPGFRRAVRTEVDHLAVDPDLGLAGTAMEF